MYIPYNRNNSPLIQKEFIKINDNLRLKATARSIMDDYYKETHNGLKRPRLTGGEQLKHNISKGAQTLSKSIRKGANNMKQSIMLKLEDLKNYKYTPSNLLTTGAKVADGIADAYTNLDNTLAHPGKKVSDFLVGASKNPATAVGYLVGATKYPGVPGSGEVGLATGLALDKTALTLSPALKSKLRRLHVMFKHSKAPHYIEKVLDKSANIAKTIGTYCGML